LRSEKERKSEKDCNAIERESKIAGKWVRTRVREGKRDREGGQGFERNSEGLSKRASALSDKSSRIKDQKEEEQEHWEEEKTK